LVICVIAELSLRLAGTFYLNRIYARDSNQYKKSRDSINIVCLGESSTEGIWVAKNKSYPYQLESMLREKYGNNNINVIVPPHVGQNTSQISNRIQNYLELYKPRLIILMVGCNNEWSLAESNIGKFIETNNYESLKIKSYVILDQFRLYKLLRYAYLKFIKREQSNYTNGLDVTNYKWGGPELVRFPPEKYIYKFAKSNSQAFIKLWEYDVGKIASAAKRQNVKVLLMTYHINPSYLPIEVFISLAGKNSIPLVRNDIIFFEQMKEEDISNYIFTDIDNWHPRERGYSIVAENAFNAVVANNLLDD